MFPEEGPNPTKDTMNYTCVINGFVWFGALGYYFIHAHKWFTGPKHTFVDDAEVLEGVMEEEETSGNEAITKKED